MLTGAVVVAATAADGPMIPAKLGAGAEIERSRSASWRSVSCNRLAPSDMAARPSATLRSSTRVRSARMASLGAVSRITATNLSTTVWMRGRAMSVHASAEPMIGPTRPARSRTTSTLAGAAVGGARHQRAKQNRPCSATVQSCAARPRISEPYRVFRRTSSILQGIIVEVPVRRGLLLPLHELVQQLLGLLARHRL